MVPETTPGRLPAAVGAAHTGTRGIFVQQRREEKHPWEKGKCHSMMTCSSLVLLQEPNPLNSPRSSSWVPVEIQAADDSSARHMFVVLNVSIANVALTSSRAATDLHRRDKNA